MLADDLLSHFVLGSTYHVNCLGFVTVSTFFAVYLKLLVWFNRQLVCTGLEFRDGQDFISLDLSIDRNSLVLRNFTFNRVN